MTTIMFIGLFIAGIWLIALTIMRANDRAAIEAQEIKVVEIRDLTLELLRIVNDMIDLRRQLEEDPT